MVVLVAALAYGATLKAKPLPEATCPGCECMYHGRLHVYSDPGDHDYFMYILKLMIVLSAVEINFLVNPPVIFPSWRNNPSRSCQISTPIIAANRHSKRIRCPIFRTCQM